MVAKFERVAKGWWFSIATPTMRHTVGEGSRPSVMATAYLLTREEMLELRRQIDQALDEDERFVRCQWEDDPNTVDYGSICCLVTTNYPAHLSPVVLARVWRDRGKWAWQVTGRDPMACDSEEQGKRHVEARLGMGGG